MLENKYHFEFPQLYKTLLEDGMFDYTAPQYAAPKDKKEDSDKQKRVICSGRYISK